MRQRSRPLWSATLALTTTPISLFLGTGWEQVKIDVDAKSFAALGGVYTAPAVGSVAAVTTIRELGTPTSGGFQLVIFPADRVPVRTAAIAYNATAAAIASAIAAASPAVAVAGDMTAAGGALPTDATLTWKGVYKGAAPLMTADSTGLVGTGNPRIQLIPSYGASNGGYGYLEANAQEYYSASSEGVGLDHFLYLATVASTGNAYITVFG